MLSVQLLGLLLIRSALAQILSLNRDPPRPAETLDEYSSCYSSSHEQLLTFGDQQPTSLRIQSLSLNPNAPGSKGFLFHAEDFSGAYNSSISECSSGSRNEGQFEVQGAWDLQDPLTLWRDGVVVYEWDISIRDGAKVVLMEAMQRICEQTSLCFRGVGEDEDVRTVLLSSSDSRRCFASTRVVNLGLQCESVGIAMHELLHIFGMIHEHQRPGRDDYIEIDWSNIPNNTLFNFEIIKSARGNAYDYASIMHYGPFSFAQDSNRPTIRTKDPSFQSMIGQRESLSNGDILALEELFAKRGRFSIQVQNNGTEKIMVMARFLDLQNRWRWSPSRALLWLKPSEQNFLVATSNRVVYLQILKEDGTVLTDGSNCFDHPTFSTVCLEEKRLSGCGEVIYRIQH